VTFPLFVYINLLVLSSEKIRTVYSDSNTNSIITLNFWAKYRVFKNYLYTLLI
jgi:hypothetical protein